MSGALPQLASWAVEALVASALLMVLVLLVRTPVRRAFGPRVAYALWLLPALRLLLPPIPAGWRQAAVDTPISRVGETITVVILPSAARTAAPAEAVAAASGPSLASILLVAWAIVAAGFLSYHLIKHWTFCRRVLARAVTIDRIERVRVVESSAAAGPMAFGILRPTIAFPSDFEERFDADERALALAHELGHHARGDLLANWIALAVLALHWFNPLAWRAFRTFRADQELANDARVLAGRSAYERHAYACAIVKAAHGNLVGAACHLHSVKDLKGRLTMLRTQISPRRLIAGAAAVGAFGVAALGVTASGTSAAERIRTEVADATGITLPTPVAPLTPTTPASPVAPMAKSVHRVVIVKDGTTTTYEGEDARRYMAEHPAPVPPKPPVSPDAPVPPAAPAAPESAVIYSDDGAMHVAVNVDVPEVRSMNCGGSGEVVRHTGREGRAMVICTDRIARMAAAAQRQAAVAQRQAALAEAHVQRQAAWAQAHAQRMAANGERIRLVALRSALEGLRRTRDSFASNRAMSEDARRDAIDGIEDSIRDLEQDMSEHD